MPIVFGDHEAIPLARVLCTEATSREHLFPQVDVSVHAVTQRLVDATIPHSERSVLGGSFI